MAKKSKNIWLINHYASTPDTGMGGRSFYLAKALHALGHKVTLISASFNHKLQKPKYFESLYDIDLSHEFRIIRIKVRPYSNSFDKKRIWNWFVFGYRLRKCFSSFPEPPEIVLCSSPSIMAYWPARKIVKYYRAKLVFEVRDIWPLTLVEIGGYSEKHLFIRFLQAIEDKAYRESDLVLSNLPNAIEHMISRGMNAEKFAWIPNGFDSAELKTPHLLSYETKAKLPKNKFIIGYAGAIGTANAIDALIEAAELLRDKPDIAFVLVGGGKEKEVLLDRSSSLKNVFFIDPIPKNQVQSILSEFDVLYIGLTKDPLFRFGVSPNKLFDYFLAAKPIIYGIESGSYLPVEDANAGLSIPAEDPEAIMGAVLRLKSKTPKKLQEMGVNGRAYALANHDYCKLAQKLISTFEEKL